MRCYNMCIVVLSHAGACGAVKCLKGCFDQLLCSRMVMQNEIRTLETRYHPFINLFSMKALPSWESLLSLRQYM